MFLLLGWTILLYTCVEFFFDQLRYDCVFEFYENYNVNNDNKCVVYFSIPNHYRILIPKKAIGLYLKETS